VRTLGLDVCLGNNLGWEVKPFTEVVETFWGQGVVVPLPRKLGFDIAAGVEGLESLDDLVELLVSVSKVGFVG
jgi:hypothetical protein